MEELKGGEKEGKEGAVRRSNMKKIMAVLASSATVVMLASGPLKAQGAHEQSQDEKNECLLISKNCADEVDDIYQRMHRLDKEIRKGTRVYTPAELRHLQEKLQEANELLRRLEEE